MSDPKSKLGMTQTAYAKRAGISKGRVSQLVKSGIIVLENKRVNPRQADQARAAVSKMPVVGNGSIANRSETDLEDADYDIDSDSEPDGTAAELLAYRTKKEKHFARMAKVNADKAEGELISVLEVSNFMAQVAIDIRDNMSAIPSRISAMLSTMTDRHLIEQYLIKEIDNALSALADSFEGGWRD